MIWHAGRERVLRILFACCSPICFCLPLSFTIAKQTAAQYDGTEIDKTIWCFVLRVFVVVIFVNSFGILICASSRYISAATSYSNTIAAATAAVVWLKSKTVAKLELFVNFNGINFSFVLQFYYLWLGWFWSWNDSTVLCYAAYRFS